jgi:hypothetical protein
LFLFMGVKVLQPQHLIVVNHASINRGLILQVFLLYGRSMDHTMIILLFTMDIILQIYLLL